MFTENCFPLENLVEFDIMQLLVLVPCLYSKYLTPTNILMLFHHLNIKKVQVLSR